MKKKIIIAVLMVIAAIASMAAGYYYHKAKAVNLLYNSIIKTTPGMENNISLSLSQKEAIINKERDIEQNPSEQNDINKIIIAEYTKAHEESSSVIGWIYIPGTNINYPINHGPKKDLSYYLTHNWKNQDWWNGAIFMSGLNTGFDDWTLINGHNMLNGIMFSQLLKYESKSYAQKYPYIYIYKGLGDNISKYEILSSKIVNQDDFSLSIGNIGLIKMKKQLAELENGSLYDINQYNGNKILTLNTCLSNGTENHIIINAQEIS